MKEIKGNLIEYINGNLIAINLHKVQSIHFSKNTGHEFYTVNFSVDDYHTFRIIEVTESSWNLLKTMFENL